MTEVPSSKRLVLRAALRQVSPMVIRVISVHDGMNLPDFREQQQPGGQHRNAIHILSFRYAARQPIAPNSQCFSAADYIRFPNDPA